MPQSEAVPSPPPRAFISYRAEDALSVATTLARELDGALAFGEVFLDHRNIEPGEPWPERLRDEVRRADVVFVLIGTRWLTLQGAYGIRRIDHPDDWVRREIEEALTADRRIIPVLIDGASPLDPLAFPTAPQLARFAALQAVALEARRWEATLEPIIELLVERGFRRRAAAPAGAAPATARPYRSTIPARGNAPFVGRDDLMEQLRLALGDVSSQGFAVVYGPPGVGKSELAREYARRSLQLYPGGAFYVSVRGSGPPVDLAALGRIVLDVPSPADLGLRDQCLRTLLSLGPEPYLLVYDNAVAPEIVEEWLPPAGAGGHVVVTSNTDRWDARWSRVRVPPLTDIEAGRLVAEVAGDEVARVHASALIQSAGGLPVQLLPAAQTLRRATERHRPLPDPATLTDETRESFEAPWRQVSDDARLLLTAALYFQPERVSPSEIESAFVEVAIGVERFQAAFDECLDLSLLTGEGRLRLHQLLAHYVGDHAEEVDREQRQTLRDALFQRLRASAEVVAPTPTDVAAVTRLTQFSPIPDLWLDSARGPGALEEAAATIGQALVEIGHFAEAQAWYERAVVAAEQGDAQGRVDQARLGNQVHMVGYCLLSRRRFAEALPFLTRAVGAKERGDLLGRVDHESLGSSLHCVGFCVARTEGPAEARPWFERAVTAVEEGDAEGRVDRASLGRSLHQVGSCLSKMGRRAEAQPWFERAVVVKEEGNVHGRVDHESVSRSLHQVGHCLSDTGRFAEAQPWFERAVTAGERGDVHGRIDHQSLAISLRAVGSCLTSQGRGAEALPWYERAAAAAERGDVHGRVDHAALATALRTVAACLISQGRLPDAQPWLERAHAEEVKVREIGDTYQS
jgi:tetratricopeptide (TPR) repeat protein